MAEPTTSDLAKIIETLTSTVAALQSSVAELQRGKTSSGGHGTNDGQHHNDRPPRFQKMDFPRYDGKSDPLIFTSRCESYFHQQRIMEEEKVWMASYNLEEGAQMWYLMVQEDEGTPSWRRFTELLHLRYGPPLRSAPLAELAECRRTGTVAEYQDRFQALLPRAGPLQEAQRVQLFVGGLQPPLSIDVRIQNPQTLAVAMSLARQFELREQFVAPAARAPGRPLLPAPAARLALPAPPGAKPAAPGTITVEGRTIKRLSQAEQEERRRLGLCYNCDDKFTRGHNRICKRLFLLEGLEEEEDEAVEDAGTEETPVFSLQALAGVALTNMMQLQITLGATSLVAMLDSGSTHNFISEAAAARTGLPLEHRPRLTAMATPHGHGRGVYWSLV
jgi:hypothetical protein